MPAFDADHHTTTIFIMRHAPTEWNGAGRIQGQADSPLTPSGKAWATSWGTQLTGLGLQRILSSDTGRAVATAHNINQTLHLPLSHDTRLREQDWGQWTGQTMADIRRTHRDLFAQQENRGWSFCPPDGEERLAVLTRSLEALRETSRKWPHTRLLVVTHEGVLKCLVYHLAIIHSCGRTFDRMAPYHLHRLTITGNDIGLDQMNTLAFRPPAA